MTQPQLQSMVSRYGMVIQVLKINHEAIVLYDSNHSALNAITNLNGYIPTVPSNSKGEDYQIPFVVTNAGSITVPLINALHSMVPSVLLPPLPPAPTIETDRKYLLQQMKNFIMSQSK